MYNYLFIALVSFVLGFGFTILCVKFFPRLGLLDKPQNYGLSRSPIPYYGGVAIFLAFLVCVFLFVDVSWSVLGFLIALFVIAVTGFFDDMFRLNPILRLGIQVCAALFLVFFGVGILSIANPFGGVIDLNVWKVFGVPILGAVFTVVWIVVITNTVNFFDGVPGLSSGTTFIAAMTLFFLSIRPDINYDLRSQGVVAALALIIAMISLAFLIFDFPRPRILMGDTGSTFLGFLLATLAIFSGGKVATAFLVLGIPILDTVWVVLRRVFEGEKPWQGDMRHLHHRLLEFGLSERVVLGILYGFSMIFGIAAVLCSTSLQKFYVFIALGVMMVGLIVVLVVGKSGRNA